MDIHSSSMENTPSALPAQAPGHQDLFDANTPRFLNPSLEHNSVLSAQHDSALPPQGLRDRNPFNALNAPRSLNTSRSTNFKNSVSGDRLDGASAPPSEYRHPVPTGGQPTNFIHVSTVDSVRGVYTIDPGLSPPSCLVTSSPYGSQGAQNTFIESQKGNVNVDLIVLPSSDEQSMISMTVKSESGSACVRVHVAEPQNASYIRGSLSIMINALKKADIYIPRSFKGPLQMVTGQKGEVYYSEAVRASVALVSYGNGQHKSFIGGLPVDRDNGHAWLGDQLTANANEMINIYYEDEGSISTKDTGKGYLAQFQHWLTPSSQTSPTNTSPTRPLHGLRVRVARTARAIIPDCVRRCF